MYQWFVQRNVLDVLSELLEVHGNYLIFETLLNPYFKKETLDASRKSLGYCFSPSGAIIVDMAYEDARFQIFDAIHRYLLDCCLRIVDAVTYMDSPTKFLQYPSLSTNN